MFKQDNQKESRNPLFQLHYLPNNLIPFMEYFSKKLKAEHKAFGQCLILGAEPNHEILHGLNLGEDELAALPEHVRNALEVQSHKDIRKSRMLWQEFSVQMTGSLLQHLSTSSENRMIQEPTFEELCAANQVVGLFQLIRVVHSIEQDGDVAQRNVIVKQFNNMTQGSQDYNAYCKRFNTAVALLATVNRVRTQEELVEVFMYSLNPEKFKTEVMRIVATPALLQATLPEAQRYFSAWGTSVTSSSMQMQNRKQNNNRDNTNEQISITKEIINATTQVKENSVKNRVNQINNNIKNNNNTSKKQTFNQVNHRNEYNTKRSFTGKQYNSNNNQQSERSCAYCKVHFPASAGTHNIANCFRKNQNRNNTANVIMHHDAEFEEQIGCMNVCNGMVEDDSNVYYDTCATIGLIKDRHMLTQLRKIAPTIISGVGGQKITANEEGQFYPFGTQLYSPKAKFNILSHNSINKEFNIQYDNELNTFVMSHKINSKKYKFVHTKQGLFKYAGECTANINIVMEKKGNNHNLQHINDLPYTQKQIRRFSAAIELHARLNHMNDASLCKLLDNGSITNLDMTSTDLRTARQLWGPCASCLVGKMTKPSQQVSPNVNVTEIGELLHCDIYFVHQQAYLLCVDDRTGFMNVVKLESKSTTNLAEALSKVIAQYASNHHVVKYIRTDREANFLATVKALNNMHIQHQTSAPGQHVAKVERAIRTIKGRYRAVLNTLTYKLPDVLCTDLNLDVVQTINITPNINTGNSNPRELVFGTKIDANKILRAQFGDVVLAHVPNNSKDVNTKAELGLVVGRDFTDSGTIKFWDLHNQRVVARQKFTIIAVTDSIVAQIQKCTSENVNIPDFDPIYIIDQNNNVSYLDQLLGPEPILSNEDMIQQLDQARNITRVRSDKMSVPTNSFNNDQHFNNINNQHKNIIQDFNQNSLELTTNDINENLTEDDMNNLVDVRDEYVVLENNNIENTFRFGNTSSEKQVEEELDFARVHVSDDVPKINDVDFTVIKHYKQKHNNNIKTKVIQPVVQQPIQSSPIKASFFTNTDESNNKRVRKPNPNYFGKDFINLTQQQDKCKHEIINTKETTKNIKDKTFPTSYVNAAKAQDDTNNINIRQALREMPQVASESIKKELQQIVEMGAMQPIHESNASMYKKIIHSKTFLKKKYLPNKAFDKLKARLVVRGDMQFRNPWINAPKAPTVAQASINMTLAITAYNKNDFESIDIPGAYLNATTPENDREVVRIGVEETKMLIELYPAMQKFVRSDGTMLMLVVKAMYGMLNSARYWYEHIMTTLVDGGYKQNPSDECVFSYTDENGGQSIIDLWVDDLFHSYTHGSINLRDKLRNLLTRIYKKISVKDGNEVPYCGMQIEKDLVNGGLMVSSPKFLSDLLKKENVTGFANSPTTTNFMDKYSTDDMKQTIDTTKYASKLMKLMWLARLCRNDILFAVTYMSTKVKQPTIKDMDKLDHILKYLNFTKEMKTRYKPDNLQLYGYIDASYGLHDDTKGQTGIIITLGPTGAPVFCKSRKQKLVSRSSTESELIALNDGLPEIIWAKQFMENLGYKQKMITVFEDNKSTIILANKTKGATLSRTKHIQVRFYYVRELIQQKEINIVYLPTEEMIADILTKPITGGLFSRLRDKILNQLQK